MKKTVLSLPIMLVDDDREVLTLLASILALKGFREVVTLSSSTAVLPYLARQPVAVIVLDLYMPELSGNELLERICASYPRIPVIILTAEHQLEVAVECMKIGAVDYLPKPIAQNRFIASITRALELRQLNEEVQSLEGVPLPDRGRTEQAFPAIVTRNKGIRELLRYTEIIAGSQQPILITGETGVGKELFAQAIHQASRRKGKFVPLNVAGLDDLMFSDTLFGHLKGAYTGAIQDRDGLIKKAARGTLFLDEIGDLNEQSQIKLLRLLQENEYYPLGSDLPVLNLARLVFATNRDLKQLIGEAKFRKDLYYRLCTHQVGIPALRERPDDIPALLEHFVAEVAEAQGKEELTCPPALVALLTAYDFPGNVRELQAIVHDLVARSSGPSLSPDLLREYLGREQGRRGDELPVPRLREGSGTTGIAFPSFPTLREAESELIRRALEIAGGNQGNAAALLGITRQALNNRLRRNRAAKNK